MKDKYGKYYNGYSCIPRRLIAFLGDKNIPITAKHVQLYDLLWNTIDADWKNMRSGKPIPREIIRERLGIDNSYLDKMLKNLTEYGFIERIKSSKRSKSIQVYFIAEAKGDKND